MADRLGVGDLLDADVGSLSGGRPSRVALARALVTPADLLVTDEPTNHLDIDAISWLEDRIVEFTGGLVLVTHDRHFLDRVTNVVLELDRGRGHVHVGGYDAYLEGRALREEQAAREGGDPTQSGPGRVGVAEAALRPAPPSPRRIEAATRIVEGRAQPRPAP